MTATSGREVLVIVFTDMVGSTAFRRSQGDRVADDVQTVIDEIHVDLVGAHGGHVVKHTGDGMMLAFRSVLNALYFASGLQVEVRRSGAHMGHVLQMRVGVAIGDVTTKDGDYFGMAPIEAARLCALARPEQVLVTDLAVRVLGGLDEVTLIDPTAYDCKGIDEPVVAYTLSWDHAEAPQTLPAELAADPRFGFVGRDQERATLLRAWQAAQRGIPQVAVVSGAAGLGKTQLVSAVARHASDDGAVVLFGRHDEDISVPYQAIAEALRRFVGSQSPTTLSRRLGRGRGDLVRLVPELADLVDDLPAPTRGDADAERRALFDAVTDWLEQVTRTQPVVMVLDDLQWSGPPTMQLLRHLLTSERHLPLLVLATSRVPVTAQPLALLMGAVPSDRTHLIDLMPFDVATTVAFLHSGAGSAVAVADVDGIAEYLVRQSGGNAFFARELLLHLVERGALHRVDGVWQPLDAAMLGDVPLGVHQVVAERVQRLPEDAQRALNWASVIGLQFDLGLLAAVTETDPDELLDVLDTCRQADLLREEGIDRFAFSHAIARQSLYDSMSQTRRVRAHRRVAATIESMDEVSVRRLLGTLAHHVDLGRLDDDDPMPVIEYRRRAGEQALEQLSATVAVTHFERALELYETTGAAAIDPAGRVRATIALGRALLDSGSPRFEAVMRAAIEQARELENGELLGTALFAMAPPGALQTGSVVADRLALLEEAIEWMGHGDSALQARLLASTAAELHFSGDIERIQRLADDALAMARRVGDDAALRDVLGLRMAALRFPALALVRRSDAIELRRSALAVGDVTNAFMAVYRQFDAEVELGNGAAARQCAAEIAALYERQPTPVLRVLQERTVVETLWLDGHVVEAAEQLERSWATSESYGLTRQRQAARTSLSGNIYPALGRSEVAVEAWAPLMRSEYAALSGSGLGPAVVLMDAGELERAGELYRAAAADRFASVGVNTSTVSLLAFAATLCFQFGTADDADVLVERLGWFESFVAHTAGAAGSVQYYLGLLELRRDDVERALDRFDAASAQHATLDAPILEAYNQIARAVALTRRGAPGDAEAVAHIVRHIDELVAQRGVVGLRHRLDLWLTPSQAGTP